MLRFRLPLFLLLTLGAAQSAAASIVVAPTRVVFEGKKRQAELILSNNGTKTETYAVSFVHFRQLSDGKYEPITAPTGQEHFADSYVRFTPRQVTLAPGQVQIVRLQMRKPASLPAGEYRSHLRLIQQPPQAPPGNLKNPKRPFGAEIKIRFGLSVPIVVRHGQLKYNVALQPLGFSPVTKNKVNGGIVKLRIDRAGNRSIFGAVRIFFRPNRSLEETSLGVFRGLSVLDPNQERAVSLTLAPKGKMRLANGRLRIELFDEDDPTAATLAEASYGI